MKKRKTPQAQGDESHQPKLSARYRDERQRESQASKDATDSQSDSRHFHADPVRQVTLIDNYQEIQNQKYNDQQIQTIRSSKDQSRLIHQKVQELSGGGFSPHRDNNNAQLQNENSGGIGAPYPMNDFGGEGYALGDQSRSELQALRNNIAGLKNKSIVEDRRQIEMQE